MRQLLALTVLLGTVWPHLAVMEECSLLAPLAVATTTELPTTEPPPPRRTA